MSRFKAKMTTLDSWRLSVCLLPVCLFVYSFVCLYLCWILTLTAYGLNSLKGKERKRTCIAPIVSISTT